MELLIPRLNCGGCVRGVTRAIQRVDPGVEVSCDLATQIVRIDSGAEPERILAGLAEVGYPGRPVASAAAA